MFEQCRPPPLGPTYLVSNLMRHIFWKIPPPVFFTYNPIPIHVRRVNQIVIQHLKVCSSYPRRLSNPSPFFVF